MEFEPYFVHHKCPACRSAAIRPLHQVPALPGILFPVDEALRRQIVSHDLHVSQCDACSHVFTPKVSLPLNRKIYQEYYRFYPFERLETMNAPYRHRFEKIFNSLQPAGAASLLEIGCDSLAQLAFFLDKGLKCAGVAPTATPQPGVEFHTGYYEETQLPGKYDVIVSRFNLEHVVGPEAFLKKIAADLADGGRVYIQVPNARHFLESGYLNVFAHEHIHYFSERSLRAMLETHGFDIRLLAGRGEPSLIAVCRAREAGCDSGRLLADAQQVVAGVNQIIAGSAGRQIVFYGCGLPLTALLYCANPRAALPADAVLFDDNAALKGRYMPDTDLRIQPFDPAAIKSGAIVFVTASALYHGAMLAKIPLDRGCMIYTLGPDRVVEAVRPPSV